MAIYLGSNKKMMISGATLLAVLAKIGKKVEHKN